MYLQFHSVKEPSKNHDIWVRVLFGSVLGKTWVRFVLAGFGYFPSSNNNKNRGAVVVGRHYQLIHK